MGVVETWLERVGCDCSDDDVVRCSGFSAVERVCLDTRNLALSREGYLLWIEMMLIRTAVLMKAIMLMISALDAS